MKFLLERSRYLALIGVISLLIASFAAFAWGTIKTISTTLLVIQTLGKDAAITLELIELIDIFLIATTILIFAASLYELKAKLSSMIVLVMAVKFLQKMIEVKDAQELLQRGIATAVVSAVLIAFGYFGKKD